MKGLQQQIVNIILIFFVFGVIVVFYSFLIGGIPSLVNWDAKGMGGYGGTTIASPVAGEPCKEVVVRKSKSCWDDKTIFVRRKIKVYAYNNDGFCSYSEKCLTGEGSMSECIDINEKVEEELVNAECPYYQNCTKIKTPQGPNAVKFLPTLETIKEDPSYNSSKC